MNNLEVGDLVLCTVDRIVGTAVFVKIDEKNIEGEIVMSEIAPGRIRNIRDYVVPRKKIVCKVLRISSSGNIELSLRRVSQKERKEVIEKDKSEKSYISILKSVLGENVGKAVQEISKEDSVFSFLEEAKTNPAKLEKIAGKENAKKILDILNTQKKKKAVVKKEIHMTTLKPNGITLIKKVLEIFKGINARYISAGRYSLEIESEDIKTADKKLRDMIDSAEKESKKLGIEFSVK
ncbi:Translation initiation factor 2 subunit alpha [uncultured archaeon]|nr:Translation initiation factor 2 subunit alpha [uncultured archaeon]